ncbi:MAG: hypothetical protein QM796_03605 [Chthoniobacteraceae bacterium]
MKSLLSFVVALLAFSTLAGAVTLPPGIYKGFYKGVNLATGKSKTVNVYFVVGDYAEDSNSNLTASFTFIETTGTGKKTVYTPGTTYSCFVATNPLGSNSLPAVQSFTYHYASGGTGVFHFTTMLLTGTVDGTKYSIPLKLSGEQVRSIVTGSTSSDVDYSRTQFTLALDTKLTNAAIANNDTEAEAVALVTGQ